MKKLNLRTELEVKNYCVNIGLDPLLVQGAGGNVSWKQDDTLWVKASGTWLADAETKDIFVPVDLASLLASINTGDFSVSPKLKQDSSLRPSIETVLHALMPYKIVVHLHAIEILVHLVKKSWKQDITFLLANQFNILFIDYFKPGADLAAATKNCIASNPNANVIFLRNHGVVIGANSVDDVKSIVVQLTSLLSSPLTTGATSLSPVSIVDGYIPIVDLDLHKLAVDSQLFNLVKKNWALYPDHIVFLGATAPIFHDWNEFTSEISSVFELPELILIQNSGVFTRGILGPAKLAQLRCYYDVLIRIGKSVELSPLSETQILDLLNWDAEKYRMEIARK